MLKKKEIFVFFILLSMFAALHVASAINVQGLRDRLDPTQVISALHIKPEVLEIASGEFRFLLADYLLLKASVYLGGRWGETPEANKKAVSTLFRQAATLDPYFFQTCYFTQAYLPWWGKGMVQDAIEILEILKEHRDWDWQPGFFIGFDYFYFLKDNLTASGYLIETSKIPQAPPLLGLLGARLSQQGGQTETAIAFLKTMYKGTENEAGKEEILRRIAALEGVLVLEKGIAQYSSTFGHPPETLEKLVGSGILKKLPVNPSRTNGSYLYKDGKIDF